MNKAKQPILCATDFSPTAVEAVNIAAGMAKQMKAKLILVHVNALSGISVADPGLFEAALSAERAELDREAARVGKLGITVDRMLRSGSAFDELVSAAVESNARLIVIGAVGHGLTRRLLVGSVAERTAGTSPVPTLVVRPGARLASWIEGKHPLKILAGYDFSAAGDAALRWINEIQEVGPCQISVLHIDWPPDEARRLGYHGPLSLSENPEQIQSFLERDLSERVTMILPPEKVTIMVESGWGRTEGHLFEMAHREGADLVVVGTHRRHGLDRLRFGSVSRAVLHHATVTVAVIPPPEEQERSPMPKLDRVLVATDFSELGNKAVGYGCAILPRRGLVKLVHVIEPNNSSEAKNQPRPGKENPKLRSQLRATVPLEATERVAIEEEVIESGNVAEAIAQAAERFGADAICLGSHGQGGLTEALLGSVAQGVMSRSKRPVLIVRADGE